MREEAVVMPSTAEYIGIEAKLKGVKRATHLVVNKRRLVIVKGIDV